MLRSHVPAKTETASNNSSILGNASHMCACVSGSIFKDLVLDWRSAIGCVCSSPKHRFEQFGMLEVSYYGGCYAIEMLSIFLQFGN